MKKTQLGLLCVTLSLLIGSAQASSIVIKESTTQSVSKSSLKSEAVCPGCPRTRLQ
jgi:hypothetical protein